MKQKIQEQPLTPLIDLPVECLTVLSSGIWMGTREGLWQLNPPSTTATRYAERATVRDIASTPTAVWFTTNTGEGLCWVRSGAGRAQSVGIPTNDRRTAQMLALVVFRSDLCVATEGGLFRYDPRRQRWEEPITQERHLSLSVSPLHLWAISRDKITAYDRSFQPVDVQNFPAGGRPIYENMRLQWVVTEENQLTLYSYATTAKSLHRHSFRLEGGVELRYPLRATSLFSYQGQRWVGLCEEPTRRFAPVRGALVRLDSTLQRTMIEVVGAGIVALGGWKGSLVLGTTDGVFLYERKI